MGVAFLVILVVLLVQTVRPVRHVEGGTGMKPLVTIKSGGAASWAIRLVAGCRRVRSCCWIPTRASDGLIETVHHGAHAHGRGDVAEPAARASPARSPSATRRSSASAPTPPASSCRAGAGARSTRSRSRSCVVVRGRRAGVVAGVAHQGRVPRARHAGARPGVPAVDQVARSSRGSPVAAADKGLDTEPASTVRRKDRPALTRSSAGTRGATCAART